jgi:hypothetical protein
MNLAYGLFMAEAEGYLDTREGKIQKCINEFVKFHKRGFDISSIAIQNSIIDKCNLTNLSLRELQRIESAVQRRI